MASVWCSYLCKGQLLSAVSISLPVVMRLASQRRTILYAAAFTLVQGSLTTGAAIFFILLYNCKASISTNSTVIQFTYLVYFSNTKCSKLYAVSRQQLMLVDVNQAAERTMGVMYFYAILNLLWILSSTMMIVSSLWSDMQKSSTFQKVQYMHYTWTGMTVAVLVVDVLATITYLLDLRYTTSLEDLLKFLNIEIINGKSHDLHSMLSIPTLLLVLFCCQFVLVWIIDVVLVILVAKAHKIISASKLFKLRRKNRKLQVYTSKGSLASKETLVSFGNGGALSLPRLVSNGMMFTQAAYCSSQIHYSHSTYIIELTHKSSRMDYVKPPAFVSQN